MADFNFLSLCIENNLCIGPVENTYEGHSHLQPSGSQSHLYEFDTGYSAYESREYTYAAVGPFGNMVSM